MKTSKWLSEATAKLDANGIGTARLDCLILLEDAIHKGRAHILANPDDILKPTVIKKLNLQLKKRAEHIPLAYIRGKTEFFGREFTINENVLEPRPESETIIELILAQPRVEHKIVADIGTGSGALGITVALEKPSATVYLTDIDSTCLTIARKNLKKHNAKAHVIKGNLLEPLNAVPLDIILANLPYVPNDYVINEAALNEPRLAIFGGEDGLKLYRQLFSQIEQRSQKPERIFTESLPFQHTKLARVAEKHGYRLTKEDDFIQQFELN